MITNWIVRGVDANAHDIWQVGVEANDPFTALSRAVTMMRVTSALNAARMVGDNYEPADLLPPPYDTIVGWRVEPVRMEL